MFTLSKNVQLKFTKYHCLFDNGSYKYSKMPSANKQIGARHPVDGDLLQTVLASNILQYSVPWYFTFYPISREIIF